MRNHEPVEVLRHDLWIVGPQTLPVPEGWHLRPAAYLSFSEAYDRQRAQAAAWGWPVSTLTGTHLHSLADPKGTAAAIEDLVRRLGIARPNDRAGL